jgi:hypothetical protein
MLSKLSPKVTKEDRWCNLDMSNIIAFLPQLVLHQLHAVFPLCSRHPPSSNSPSPPPILCTVIITTLDRSCRCGERSLAVFTAKYLTPGIYNRGLAGGSAEASWCTPFRAHKTLRFTVVDHWLTVFTIVEDLRYLTCNPVVHRPKPSLILFELILPRGGPFFVLSFRRGHISLSRA